jgi:hypothetical protein
VLYSFEHITRDWLASIEHTVARNAHHKKTRLFEMHVFPVIGYMGISDVKSPPIFEIVKPLTGSGRNVFPSSRNDGKRAAVPHG